MMPDLGPHTFWVLASYGVALGLIALIVAVTLWRAARIRRALRAVEDRQAGSRDG
jgi:heme exporter protein D